MTTTQAVVVNQNNDTTLLATVLNHDTLPSDGTFNITGMQLDFWIKTSKITPDTDPATVHLSTVTGEITLTNPTLGIASIFIAKTRLLVAGNLWYRLDVTSGGQLKTAGNGLFIVGAQ